MCRRSLPALTTRLEDVVHVEQPMDTDKPGVRAPWDRYNAIIAHLRELEKPLTERTIVLAFRREQREALKALWTRIVVNHNNEAKASEADNEREAWGLVSEFRPFQERMAVVTAQPEYVEAFTQLVRIARRFVNETSGVILRYNDEVHAYHAERFQQQEAFLRAAETASTAAVGVVAVPEEGEGEEA